MLSSAKSKARILIIALITVGFCTPASAEIKLPKFRLNKNRPLVTTQIKPPKYAEGEVLVKFKSYVFKNRITALTSKTGTRVLKVIPKVNIYRLKSIKGKSTKELIELYNKDADVEYAEPNYIIEVDANPNDQFYSLLWGFNNFGQTGGTADADIDAPEAWDYMPAYWANVVVAVIDTGVDYNHPDLANNIWSNPGEVPGDGIDNDGNGFIDDFRGWDFYNNDNDPFDDHYHGTHVAGTIAAVGNNAVGVIGVNYKAKIMPVKFLSASGSGYTSDAVEAILYAAGEGAKVMNNSWGGTGYSSALRDAITTAYANGQGAVFVAAAGNSASDNDYFPHYPSSYDNPNVIAVAATNHTDNLAWFSCYGFTSVDLGAPGESIYSAKPPDQYQYLNGTSMATPHVSGDAALILSAYPYLNVDEVKNLLMNSSDGLASLQSKTVTGGRLNVLKSLNLNDKQIKVYLYSPQPPYIFNGENNLIKVTVSAAASNLTGANVTASFSNGEPTLTLYDDGAHNDGAMNDGTYANNWSPVIIGSCDITILATRGGYSEGSRSITYNIIERVDYDYNVDTYNWIDATTGTALTLTDDSYAEIPIGFNFRFYGINYSSLKVSSNGYLTFDTYASDFTNDSIPTVNAPNNVIAPFWDDLNPANGGKVSYLLTGTAPNRVLTIEWYQIPRYLNIGAATFEASLYETTNEIVFRYQDVYFEDDLYNAGRDATVGIEGPTGTYGTQYSYNSASLYNFLALKFYEISRGTISGKVLLQGRTNHSKSITFELRSPGQTTPVATYQVTTNSDGSFRLIDINSGTYDMTAKASNFLRGKQANVIVSRGQDTSNMNFDLLGGDCDNNNTVSMMDLTIFRAAYGSRVGEARWNPEADFNGNSQVDLTDLAILRSNYGKSGAQ